MMIDFDIDNVILRFVHVGLSQRVRWAGPALCFLFSIPQSPRTRTGPGDEETQAQRANKNL